MHARQEAPGPFTVLRGHGCDVQCVEPIPSSSSSSLLASGDISGNVRIWDLSNTMRSVFDLKLHPEPSAGILTLQCMNQHGETSTTMMSSGRDGVIRLWTIDEGRGEPVATLQPFSNDNPSILTGAYSFCRPIGLSPSLIFHASMRQGCVDVWDTRIKPSGPPSLTLSLSQDKGQGGGGMCMALSLAPSSSDICRLLAGFEDGSLTLWDLRLPSLSLNHDPGVKRGHNEPVMCLDAMNVSESSKRVDKVQLMQDEVEGPTSNQRTDEIELPSTTSSLKAGDEEKQCQLAASGSADDKILIWAMSQDDTSLVKKREATITQSDPGIAHLAWSPDGRVLASAGWDGKVRLWSAKARQLAILRYHQSQSTCVKFLPRLSVMHTDRDDSAPLILQDQILASSSRDGTIALWLV